GAVSAVRAAGTDDLAGDAGTGREGGRGRVVGELGPGVAARVVPVHGVRRRGAVAGGAAADHVQLPVQDRGCTGAQRRGHARGLRPAIGGRIVGVHRGRGVAVAVPAAGDVHGAAGEAA